MLAGTDAGMVSSGENPLSALSRADETAGSENERLSRALWARLAAVIAAVPQLVNVLLMLLLVLLLMLNVLLVLLLVPKLQGERVVLKSAPCEEEDRGTPP